MQRNPKLTQVTEHHLKWDDSVVSRTILRATIMRSLSCYDLCSLSLSCHLSFITLITSSSISSIRCSTFVLPLYSRRFNGPSPVYLLNYSSNLADDTAVFYVGQVFLRSKQENSLCMSTFLKYFVWFAKRGVWEYPAFLK